MYSPIFKPSFTSPPPPPAAGLCLYVCTCEILTLSDIQHVSQMIPDHTLLMHFSTFLEPSTRCILCS
ncbi:hypothetical protein CHARACLAT_004514 [Characodon lateralis]|uniref:Uncharacterized protein n=1 Tax=Characodon lateralis TaxID=208331 RepID=A0ABU7DDN8_9TELE|nr:hypothetical protein [Characodon lateralis]